MLYYILALHTGVPEGAFPRSKLPVRPSSLAFFPAVEEGADEDSDDYGMVILKSITENGEDFRSANQALNQHPE